MISCGHIEGVSAEKGPPGVGTNSEELYFGVALILTPSLESFKSISSSSSSDNVSALTKHKVFP
jgi:hypothetical protein